MDDLTDPKPADPAVPPNDADAPPPDPQAGFRRWASLLFALLFALIVLGSALIGRAAADRATFEVLVAAIGIALGGFAIATLLVGLDRRREWAIPAAVASCWILVAAAVVRVAVDLSHGNVTIPLEGIAAALVLTRRPRPVPALAARDGRLAFLVTLLFVASEAWPLLTDAVYAGRVFGAPAEALTLTVTVACSDLRDVTASGQVSRVIDTTASWAWSQSEFLAGGDDGMLVHIVGNGESTEGASWEPVLISDDLDTQGPGIWRGMATPSSALLQMSMPGSALEVGIDVGVRGLADGSVSATLVTSSNPPPAHGSVQVWADYAHLDHWRATSEPVTCTW